MCTCFFLFLPLSLSILYLTDRRDDKVIESNKRFTTTSRLQLSPTPEEDYVEYSCQAKHKALQPDMPMRATVQLSVLCKYTREIHAHHAHCNVPPALHLPFVLACLLAGLLACIASIE